MRLGASGPSPFDSAGPVTVNLANGNVAVSFASPTVATLGGSMGMAFSYNSQQDNRGLVARFFDAGQTTPTYTFTGRTPVLERTDSVPTGSWGLESPALTSVPVDKFLGQWTGYLTLDLPTGNYQFGAKREDGAQAFVADANGTMQQVVNQWTATTGVPSYGPTINLVQGQPRAVRFEMFEAAGNASVEFWVKTPSGATMPVPASWFTKAPQALPYGWSSSSPIAGWPGFIRRPGSASRPLCSPMCLVEFTRMPSSPRAATSPPLANTARCR